MPCSHRVGYILIIEIFITICLGGCNSNEQFYSVSRSKHDSFKIGEGSDVSCSPSECPKRSHQTFASVSYAKAPTLNINATCRNAGSVLHSNSLDCIDDENAADQLLKKQWASFRVADREACLKQSSAYNPSYVEALTCLEMNRNPSDHLWAKWDVPHSDTDVTGSIQKKPPTRAPTDKPSGVLAPSSF